MCGIAGLLTRDRNDASARLTRMLTSMHARGPDGEGRLDEDGIALGMRRLAILDLANGAQPFSTDDGEIVAFVNGEIYNHAKIRAELESKGVRFRTGCDAEVIPHAYRAWGGEEFVRKLDGMFGIAILDRRRRSLSLYRDRYGEKPVFYSSEPECFRFASQLSTLAVEPEFDFAIDRQALSQYLALHSVPGPRTMVEGIQRLLPGHCLSVALDSLALSDPIRWVDHECAQSLPRTYRHATRALRARLASAVESRMIADVPVGVFLSGGLDSSAVAAIAQKHSGRVETFSVGFADAALDESGFARTVASALGTNHHHYEFDLAACLEVFDDAIESLDEPLGDPACLPVYLLSREASRHVKVVLTGEGADEVFAGYDYYPSAEGRAPSPFDARTRIANWLRRVGRRSPHGGSGARNSGALPFEFFQQDNTTPSGFPLLTSHAERRAFLPGIESDESAWTRELMGDLAGIDCESRRAQSADLSSWLPDDLLTKLDRMTMAASIEGRAPFLDPAVAEFGLAMPADWKGGASRRKRVLRDAVAGDLPVEIQDRPKQGFVLPMQEWLVGPLRTRLLDNLAEDLGDGLELELIRALVVEDLGRGASRSRLLYGLLAYREWARGLRAKRAEVVRGTSDSVHAVPLQSAMPRHTGAASNDSVESEST